MEIKELNKVVFKKGDIFVLTIESGRGYPKEAMDRIKESVDMALIKSGLKSGDVTILVFEDKIKYEIWRACAKTAKPDHMVRQEEQYGNH